MAKRATAIRRPPMIFFNIGWMRAYKGPTPSDPTRGGFGYLKSHPHGAECYNFASSNGQVRGYCYPGVPLKRLNIDRIGARKKDEVIDGVLVVWMAREPVSRRTLVVGWYSNATVYRSARDTGRSVNGDSICYSAEASAADAKLLPVNARTFQIASRRTSKEGFGQSPIWYGSEAVKGRVWSYVQSVGHARPGAKRPQRKPKVQRGPRNLDPELRRKIERAAVDHAIKYYRSAEGGRCTVKSVELQARGCLTSAFVGRIEGCS